jgi:hypothetical protein
MNLLFRVSSNARQDIDREAHQHGVTARALFRHKANMLLEDTEPLFDVSGDALTVEFYVNMPERVEFNILCWMAKRGLPRDAIGELIARYRLREAV